MAAFTALLRRNRNYRYTWLGQVVSEIGDHFNNIAVFSLAVEATGSGLIVSGVMLSRAIPAVLAGPVAGVVLDRFDRRRIMIASDLVRAVVALGFIWSIGHPRAWVLYLLSALLMFASPFFTAGRAAILPTITSPEELHTANSLMQTTQWATQTAGTILAGFAAARFGYAWAFLLNSFSFVFSAAAVALLSVPEGFRARRAPLQGGVIRPWREYAEGLAYMRAVPLIFAIGMISVGWATGGGAAQILFVLFGQQVFHRGAEGIGTITGLAGLGLLLGGGLGHIVGRSVGFSGYKRAIAISYVAHGATYIAFCLMRSYGLALVLICMSRIGMAVSSVLNYSQLLRHTADEYRGRVFSTMESLRWGAMILSMAAAGVASQYYDPRTIGVAAGILSSLTAVYWTWANPPEPKTKPSAETGVPRPGTSLPEPRP